MYNGLSAESLIHLSTFSDLVSISDGTRGGDAGAGARAVGLDFLRILAPLDPKGKLRGFL